jgi:acetyl-CoA carboxylase carboxyl transferase subunit alpha
MGVGDRICVLENAYYSVISPEGCSAILWKKKGSAEQAAEALKLTAKDLLNLEIIDEVIPEPLGGAHRNYEGTASNVKESILRHLAEVNRLSKEEMLKQRYEKFRKIGIFRES